MRSFLSSATNLSHPILSSLSISSPILSSPSLPHTRPTLPPPNQPTPTPTPTPAPFSTRSTTIFIPIPNPTPTPSPTNILIPTITHVNNSDILNLSIQRDANATNPPAPHSALSLLSLPPSCSSGGEEGRHFSGNTEAAAEKGIQSELRGVGRDGRGRK
ncbi:hypothetical protein MMC25_005986 [Agyrium rufum]|nr:hypothetical protein [Agyrium rufum]